MKTTTQGTRRRAVIYCRISDDPNGRAAGVQRQEADCRALAEELGWDVVAVRTDNDISAYSGKPRPAYRALLEDIREERADAVLAWHPDRLYRRLPDLEELTKAVQARGAAIRTCRAGELDLNTASGVMQAEILAAVSKHEVAHATERIKAAKDEAAAQGRYRGGPRPFGYEGDGVTVREDEAKHVRAATDAIIAGDSLRSLCRDLAAKGVRTVPRARRNADGTAGEPESREWQPPELRKLLLRPRNAGLLEITVTGPDGKKRSETRGRAQWPALVDEDTWRACKAVLEHPERRTTTGNARAWLGSGLYRCGTPGCAETVRCSTSGRGSGDSHVPAYRCRTGKHVTRVAGPLDEFVVHLALARLSRPDAAELLLPPAATGDAREDLAKVANALRAKLAGYTQDYDADLITRQQMLDGTALTRKRLEKIEADMAARAHVSVLASVPLGDSDAVDREWPGYHLDKRRAILDALMVVTLLPARRGRPPGFQPGVTKTYFNPDAVRIDWKHPG
ncbi:recombinase family protein [Streptomyces sp. NPDC059161]|uniref:recombinase family protein n=1 Tax=Streptomyces sp. NPDC059161 TaxID=3346749 RepID=UPI003677BE75